MTGEAVKIGIGIDTGGTYTDAVLYDFDRKEILASDKALTTKDDLSAGIGNALDGLPTDMIHNAEVIALSTTLATNACVEDKGGRAKLLFIGVQKWVAERVGNDYGLPNPEEIFFLGGETNPRGEVVQEPDWHSFLETSRAWINGVSAVAVVERDAMDNGAVLEKKARDLIREQYGVPVVCGHELYSDLNSMQRGSSILLNARLIPLITEFLEAAMAAIRKRAIHAPVVIVRSDGSLMSESFAARRPVETLLCGPAASAIGGMALAKEKDCLIVDMGGTTTDIALVRNGVPAKAKDGVRVGKWSTFVRGLFVDTVGLGGDSGVRVDDHGEVTLVPTRLIPLSVAATRWPLIVEKLRDLVSTQKKHPLPVHEFYCLSKPVRDQARYAPRELAFCRALANGPLSLREAAEALGTDIYNLDVLRLEEEGVVIRCGLTPTDVMHVKGDFARFSVEAARLGVEFVSSSCGISPDAVVTIVYDLVKKTLYRNIVRVLLEDRYPAFRKAAQDDRLEQLLADSWDMSRNGAKDFLRIAVQTPAALVGIGAPIHLFLPDVAKALQTRCVIPQNAGVANALGAVLGNITATFEILVRPQYTISGIEGYVVFGKDHATRVLEREAATAMAIREAEEAASEEVKRRGATGGVSVESRVVTSAANSRGGTDVLIEIKAVATAVGRIMT